MIATYPDTWTRSDVMEWLTWCSNEYALHNVPFNKFEMNGNYITIFFEKSSRILLCRIKSLLCKKIVSFLLKSSG